MPYGTPAISPAVLEQLHAKALKDHPDTAGYSPEEWAKITPENQSGLLALHRALFLEAASSGPAKEREQG